ncbi:MULTISPECIES: outer membrane beta-barrel protein [Flavobacterium]|uniref:Outer membrane beta-barrel protein n=1 Tax=Flavobacterium jumunjinense TaxID=998845 RepID=A0ABV5GKN1_9FLAO|nr:MULTISPECIES: outer membrane beta-barrel protein [Flavobacterium]
MKKQIFIAIFAIFGMSQIEAQVSFKPGVRAGLNFSHFTKGDDFYNSNGGVSNRREFNSKTDFYLGFYGALKLTNHYTLQPEIDYSRQGSKLKFNNSSQEGTFNISYLGVQIMNKFTFADKFNIHIGPGLDFQVEENFPAYNSVDLTFVLGAGYQFTDNFGIEARVKKGIIPVLSDDYDYDNNYYSDGNHTNVVFSIGATYTFDVK